MYTEYIFLDLGIHNAMGVSIGTVVIDLTLMVLTLPFFIAMYIGVRICVNAKKIAGVTRMTKENNVGRKRCTGFCLLGSVDADGGSNNDDGNGNDKG